MAQQALLRLGPLRDSKFSVGTVELYHYAYILLGCCRYNLATICVSVTLILQFTLLYVLLSLAS
jgi:hypothetical protein